jgi:hypothetical protein
MSTRNLLALTALAAVALPSTAMAWEHTGWAWNPLEMPLTYIVGNDTVFEDSIDATVDGEPYEVWVAKESYSGWQDATCAEFTHEFIGTTTENYDARTWDGQTHITYDDPGDAEAAGVLAVTFTFPGSLEAGEFAFNKNGNAYYWAEDSDIVFNNDVDFGTDTDIDAGLCLGESSMEAVLTHEVGHLLGMAHSCEDGDVCSDSLLREATMYWSAGPCDTNGSTISQDDIDGLTALYGPFATFECSHELDPESPDTIAQGNVPFDLKCAIVTDASEEISGASWIFGDGGTSDELNPKHTYDVPGNYSIEACFDGVRDTCGEWEYCYRKIGYVRACGVPEPEFTIEHVDGLTYALRNESDVSVYGCIYEIQWDVFQGDTIISSLNAWEPQITFPSEGDFKIVLNLGGPAGTGAAALTVTAEDYAGEGYGCNAVGGAVGGLGWLVGVGLVVARARRRND